MSLVSFLSRDDIEKEAKSLPVVVNDTKFLLDVLMVIFLDVWFGCCYVSLGSLQVDNRMAIFLFINR